MRNDQTPPGAIQTHGPTPETASILYMLNCYDVWSATPDRTCAVPNAGVDQHADTGL